MVRRVDLTGEAKKHFQWLYEGLLIGAALKQQRSAVAMKTERRVFRALKGISVPMTADGGGPMLVPQTQEANRQIVDEGGVLTLEQDEATLICDYIESVPWLVTKGDLALDAVDYVNASPKE